MPYCKLDSGIVYSSIWSESLATRVVFVGMLAIKDHEGFVHGVRSGLARILNVTKEELEEALTVLLRPDAESRTKDEDGRRVLEVAGGWFIVNHEKYRDMKTDNPSAIKMRVHRKKQKEATESNALSMLPTEVTPVYVSVSGINKASNVSNDPQPTKRFSPPSLREVTEYCDEIDAKINPERFLAFYESKGWKIGSSPMKNWKAAVRTWKLQRKDDSFPGRPSANNPPSFLDAL